MFADGKTPSTSMGTHKQLRTVSKDGSLHVTDERINTLVSGCGAGLSFIAVGYLVMASVIPYKPWHLLGFTIYGFTLINLFSISALHHGIDASPKLEYMFRQFDYFSIFLFIAGSFTPVCLVLVRHGTGFAILAMVWLSAIGGIALKALYPDIPKWVTNAMYVGMGWMGALYILPVFHKVGWEGILVFFIGGVLYTGGSFIYYFEKPNPVPGKFGFHEIWHFCVLAAAASHYFFMYFFILPS